MRGLSTALDVQEFPGHQSVVNVAAGDRDKLVQDRSAACSELVSSVQALRQRCEKNDQMLINYDRDLNRLASVFVLFLKTTGVFRNLKEGGGGAQGYILGVHAQNCVRILAYSFYIKY